MHDPYDFTIDPRFKDITPFPSRILLASPTMHGDELKWVQRAFETNWVTTVGENINALEEGVAGFIGRKYAVGLSCGTAALHLAIRLAAEKVYGVPRSPEIGALKGRRVFCSDMTFDATVNPVAYEGGEAVFIDSEYGSWNMDPTALEKAFEIYPDVRIIVLAHLYGTPGDVCRIREIADGHGALIVEDAAESLGASVRLSDQEAERFKGSVGDSATSTEGEKSTTSSDGVDNSTPTANADVYKYASKDTVIQTGCFGDISIISFNGNKMITGSSGGMLLTDDSSDADKIRKWSTQSREAAPWYQHEELGYNYRMSNVIAGIVRGQMGYLSSHIEKKKEIYERYREGLRGLPLSMNPVPEDRDPNYWLSCALIDEDAMCPQVRGEKEWLYTREPGKSCPQEILEVLNFYNAEGRPIWKPMHLQPLYRGNGFVTVEGNGRARSDAYIEGTGVDVGADVFNRGLCLPSDNKMTEEEQEKIIDIIHCCFQWR